MELELGKIGVDYYGDFRLIMKKYEIKIVVTCGQEFYEHRLKEIKEEIDSGKIKDELMDDNDDYLPSNVYTVFREVKPFWKFWSR